MPSAGGEPGELVIEGQALHFWDGDGTEWKYRGDEVGTESGSELAIWIEDEKVYYVDVDGTVRALPTQLDEFGDPVSGVKGSIWIESKKITYVDGTGSKRAAGIKEKNRIDDPAHDDHTDEGHDDHTDSDHHNHSNYHVDYGGGHTDEWEYRRGGTKYFSDHTDTGVGHTDDFYDAGHDDHTDNDHDNHDDTHSDTPHDDFKDHTDQPTKV